jgi:DNA mismatch repair protein MutS
MDPPGTESIPKAPSKLTPMMRQYRAAKSEHPEAILFFRMGDFYEMFDDDAVLCSRLLGITLTTRDKKAGHPMAGVPWHSAEGYIAKLVRMGYRVAICEQVEDPKQAKGLVERKVTELITPGTAIERGLVLDNENTYLLALRWSAGIWGAALVDASTGEFMAGDFDEQALVEETGTLPVAEILVPEETHLPEALRRAVEARGQSVMVTTRPPWWFDPAGGRERLARHFGTVSLDPYDAADLDAALGAASALLDYLAEMRGSEPRHVTALKRLRPRTTLTLDPGTLAHLDVVPGRGEPASGTLLGVVDATRTPMGARLLRGWMCRPSVDREQIDQRLDAVEVLAGDDGLRGRLRTLLGRLGDLERLAGRVEAGKGGARELRAIAEGLAQVPSLAAELESASAALLVALRATLDGHPGLRGRLLRELVDQPPLSINEGGIFRDGVHPELDQVREAARSGKRWIAELEAKERQRTGAKLKVGFNKVFGYYIEVSRSQLGSVPDDYVRKQTLVGAERFITPELKDMEAKVLGAEERIVRMERELFVELRDAVNLEVASILKTARAIQALDVFAALAEVARTRGYVRPTITADGTLEIVAGRHPVVEAAAMEEGFVPNDIRVGGDHPRVLIITGPNMAGKSTYLRQVGLITLLAHTGSFVPAEAASVPVTDRIFTRVGAADRIASGQSTFLVEMNETAVILHHATERSLVLLDEIGRGTSTYDGLSIAWAVAEYLHGRQPSAPRTLFATHYHELTRLAEDLPGVDNLNVAVDESGGRVTFLHRIVPGAADRSYGIHVAELAGIPDPVIRRAQTILERLERGETVRGGAQAVQLGLFGWPQAARGPAPSAAAEPKAGAAAEQVPSAAAEPKAGAAPTDATLERLAAELARLDPATLRPIEALQLIDRWRRELTGEE